MGYGSRDCSVRIRYRKCRGRRFLCMRWRGESITGFWIVAEYLPVVRKGWAGLLTHVYADGRLGSIQPIGGGPDTYKPQTSYVFGVGAFLMAGSEMRELAEHKR